ncbi:MAG TPA: glycosyltransferase family 4 protein [Thermoplasmata archaeon]|nr:glycosyltransferase family 4 protein [Thermoplasmata archaeon]HYB77956.1 glycosyltransferase family 4 protein [Thermoplasmata archaeon]
MKIVHVLLRFDAPGGVETNVREVTRRLKEAGEDVEVFASDLYDEGRWERRSGYRPVVDGVPVRRFPVEKRLVPGLTMPMMVGLIDALAESGADVIHAHSHRYGHVLEASAVAERLGIPLVVSTHYHPADRREPPWKRGLLRIQDYLFGMTAYRVARAVVVQTDREGRLVGEFAPREKLRTIAPGVDLASWSNPENDRTEGLDLPDRYLLFVGRVAPNKGLPTLLDALARLDPTTRPPLVLMGRDWGERSRLEERARALGISETLRFLDHVDPASAYRGVLRNARALVLPSEWEAFGLVLLEAMAAGTPIVATAVGGVPELLENGRSGRLVPYGDADALAEALRSALTDQEETERLRMAALARARGFDWSVTVDRHRALYREVTRR